jgi:LmbE family N-acetylglucosaminyl deacetylase
VTSSDSLPAWGSVLVVVAHPDDESFALGALLDRFVGQGAEVSVLCLTRGEASTLGADVDDLASVRAGELEAAGAELGVGSVTLLGRPDGGLARVDRSVLVADVAAEVERMRPDGILVFDPVAGVTGHSDHEVASRVAADVAARHGVPVLGWALPTHVAAALNAEYGAAFAGHPTGDLAAVPVNRSRQRRAVECHGTQAVPGSVLWRRLELLGDLEYVRPL